MKQGTLLYFLALLFIGCNESSMAKNNRPSIKHDSILNNDSVINNRPYVINDSIINFKKIVKDISNLRFTKMNNYPSSYKDTTLCKNWSLNEQIIKEIFTTASPITSQEWDYTFDHLPCTYQGVFRYKGKEYDFSINAGGWFTTNLVQNDNVFGYGCSKQIISKYFLPEVKMEKP